VSDLNEERATPVEERGIPSITGRKRKNGGKLIILAVTVVALGVALGGAALFVKRLTEKKLAEKEAERNRPTVVVHGNLEHEDLEAQKARIKREEDEAKRNKTEATEADALPVPAGAQPVVPETAGPSGQERSVPARPSGREAQSHVESPAERRLAGSVMVLNVRSDSATTGATEDGGGFRSARPASSQDARKNVLDDQLAPSMISRASATVAGFLPDRRYLLKRGTIIPCVAGTKIVTTYPGMISCSLTRDVYSADGSTLLLGKGAEVIGEQRFALLHGQARIFALMTRVDDGPVTVALDSPVADSLGGSGLEAYVDSHFWERFGGATMVALINDFGQALANQSVDAGNATTINLSNTSQSTQNLAAETLRSTINIPPTGYANQGVLINIFVARDIDFSGQYELVSMSSSNGGRGVQ